MQLGEISFCDKVGYNVKQDAYKETILQELETNYGFKVVQRHHENFDPNSSATQKRMNSVPHLVSTKTNGNPYLLYLTKYNFANQCIFIDKKIQHGYFLPRMICVKLWFHDRLFENTLFDGEMVKDNDNNWTYIINDIIAKENNVLTGLKLIQRMNIIYSTLKDNYFEDSTACCRLCVKKYFKIDEIPYIIEQFIPNLNYTCRGLYFKPIYTTFKSLLYNFNPSLIKSVVRMKYTDLVQKTFLSETDTRMATNDSKRDNTSLKRRRGDEKLNLPSKKGDKSIIKTHDHRQPIKPSDTVIPLAIKTSEIPLINSLHPSNIGSSNTDASNLILEHAYLSSLSYPPSCTLKDGEKIFCVRKTKLPDVYEMQMYKNYKDDLCPTLETACVQDRKTSKMMRQKFNNRTFLEKLDIVCSYNSRFHKWQPLYAIEDRMDS